MERREDIKVKNGFEYDHYFPKTKLITITKKKGATVADTIRFIPTVVNETLFHTKRFAHEVIKADSLHQTCKNIWDFVYTHIAYKKDEEGKEQVRSPARAWHDRGNIQGVDCDCYTVFISSILSNLKIKHILRITKYGEDHFQHIYPIVPLPNGRYITIDCVVNSFDYEEPYTEKKDTHMDLEYLNGVNDSSKNNTDPDMMGWMDEREALSELGKIFKRKTSSGGSTVKKPLFNKPILKKPIFNKPLIKKPVLPTIKKGAVKNFLKNTLHVTNRINPATVLLRNGVLAAMKLNFLQVSSNLRYTYLSEAQAKQKGMLMDRFAKLKTIREKLEKVFYGAGGKPENLKKAILTGKGNQNKEVPVNGLGYISYEKANGLHEDMQLSQLIGVDIYHSENIEGMNGLGELGEPTTAASIAAATTVLTTIAALIKSVGSLFPNKKNASTASENTGGGESGGGAETSSSNESASQTSNESPGTETSSEETGTENTSASDTSTASETNTAPTTDENGEATTETDASNTSSAKTAARTGDETAPTFWEKNKKWIKPTGIAVGTIGLIALTYQLLKPKAKPKAALNGTKKTSKTKHLLNGIKSKKKKGGKSNPRKKSKATKKTIALL